MSSEKRSVKRVIVPSPVPELPGVASVTCGTVSAVAVAAIARLSGRISASFALPASRCASARHALPIAQLPALVRTFILLATGNRVLPSPRACQLAGQLQRQIGRESARVSVVKDG